MENKILINILTRTSDRPNYFANCRKSILSQTYPYIRHLVYTDNAKNSSYILENGVNPIDLFVGEKMAIDKEKHKIDYIENKEVKLIHRPYNLYLNQLNSLVTDGWVIYLDDDDMLMNKNAIQKVVDILKSQNENEVLIFKGRFINTSKYIFKKYYLPNTLTMRQIKDGLPIKLGSVGGICFAFHWSIRNDVIWDEYSGGDFRVISRLLKKYKFNVLDEVITGVQTGPNGGRNIDL